MSWSFIGILVGIFAVGFCFGNAFQILVRPKKQVIKQEVTLDDFIRSRQDRHK